MKGLKYASNKPCCLAVQIFFFLIIIIITLRGAKLEGGYFSMFPTNPSVLLALQGFSGDIKTFECK